MVLGYAIISSIEYYFPWIIWVMWESVIMSVQSLEPVLSFMVFNSSQDHLRGHGREEVR